VSVGATGSAACFTSTNSLHSDPLRSPDRHPVGLRQRVPEAPARSSRPLLDSSTPRGTNPRKAGSQRPRQTRLGEPTFWDQHPLYLVARAIRIAYRQGLAWIHILLGGDEKAGRGSRGG
jgi:hypothetical protein